MQEKNGSCMGKKSKQSRDTNNWGTLKQRNCQVFVPAKILPARPKGRNLMRAMWSLGSFDTTVFFQLFDAQIKPILLYASEVWGTSRLANI